MEKSHPSRKILVPGLVLAVLGALILLPRPLYGWWDLGIARRAMQEEAYAEAADAYQAAARRLPWQPSLWEQAGEAAYLAGKPQEAITCLQQSAARDAISAWGWTYLGMAYQQAGDLPSAMAAWRRALPLAEAYGFLGQAERKLGDFSAAIDDWRASTRQEPENAAAHYNLGLLLAATDPREALSELIQAASLNPELDPAIQSLRTSLNTALLSEDAAYQFVVSGRALAAAGEWDLAAEAFSRAVAIRPAYGDAWAWLGEARQHLEGDGLPDLQKAVALDPNSPLVQSLYGIYWQRQGEKQRALEAFQKAAELQPQDAGFQVALGSAYEQAGDLVSALEHYRRAVDLAPQEAAPWRALAVFSLTYAADIPGTGFPAAQRLLGLAPEDWQSHDIAGQATLEMGNLLDAERQFQKAIDLAPDQAAPYLHLGLAYLQSGDLPAAQDALVKARERDADGPYGLQAARLLEKYFH